MSRTVRVATPQDAPGIAAAVAALLDELGAQAPRPALIETATAEMIEDGQGAIVLVAELDGAPIGMLGASVQSAMHVPGRYALIQDLWVHPRRRSDGTGGALVDALCDIAQRRQLARVEVGLPKEQFPMIAATTTFYMRNGFAPLGPRMRRLLP